MQGGDAMTTSTDWNVDWAPELDDDTLMLDGNLDDVAHLFDDPSSANNAQPVALPFVQPQEQRSAYDEYNDSLVKHCADGMAWFTAEMGRLGWAQKNLALPLAQTHTTAAHVAAMNAYRDKIVATRKDALKCLGATPLKPGTIAAVRKLQDTLALVQCQLEVFEGELSALAARKAFCAARLFIVSQDAGKPVKQNSPSQVSVVVRILTGALEDIRPTSPVEAVLECGNAEVPLENTTASVGHDGTACFSELKFPSGTRSQMAHLRFRVNVQFRNALSSGAVTLVSNTSAPLIVFTGEHQYGPALGKIMAAEMFGDNTTEVSWVYFVNVLQWYYLETTRQDKKNPPRPLSVHDISYLHQFKFDNRPSVTVEQFFAFWNDWFSVAITGIRHSKLLTELWTRGYIMGFISKVGAERLLQHQQCPPGTFLLRFSERAPGSFAIAYMKRSKKRGDVVKHYLIRPNDVAPPHRTLADFLGSQTYFVNLLQIIPSSGPVNALRWRIVHKDACFEPFYGAKGATLDGYDDSLPGAKGK